MEGTDVVDLLDSILNCQEKLLKETLNKTVELPKRANRINGICPMLTQRELLASEYFSSDYPSENEQTNPVSESTAADLSYTLENLPSFSPIPCDAGDDDDDDESMIPSEKVDEVKEWMQSLGLMVPSSMLHFGCMPIEAEQCQNDVIMAEETNMDPIEDDNALSVCSSASSSDLSLMLLTNSSKRVKRRRRQENVGTFLYKMRKNLLKQRRQFNQIVRSLSALEEKFDCKNLLFK